MERDASILKLKYYDVASYIVRNKGRSHKEPDLVKCLFQMIVMKWIDNDKKNFPERKGSFFLFLLSTISLLSGKSIAEAANQNVYIW